MDIVAEIEKILKILQEEKFNPQYDFTEIKGDPGQVSAVADIVFSARIDKTMKEIQKILPDAAEFFTYSGKIEDGKLDYVDGYYVLLDLFEDLLQQAKSRGESVGKKTGILEAKSGHSFLYQMKMEKTLLKKVRTIRKIVEKWVKEDKFKGIEFGISGTAGFKENALTISHENSEKQVWITSDLSVILKKINPSTKKWKTFEELGTAKDFEELREIFTHAICQAFDFPHPAWFNEKRGKITGKKIGMLEEIFTSPKITLKDFPQLKVGDYVRFTLKDNSVSKNMEWELIDKKWDKKWVFEIRSGYCDYHGNRIHQFFEDQKFMTFKIIERGEMAGKRSGILESFSDWQKLEERHKFSESAVNGVPEKGTIEHRMIWAYEVLREELRYQKKKGTLNKSDDPLIRLTSRVKSCISAFLHTPENRKSLEEYFTNEAETHEIDIETSSSSRKKRVRAFKPDIVAWALHASNISDDYRKAKDWKATFEKVWPEVVKIYRKQQAREGEEAVVKNFLDKIAGSHNSSLSLKEQEEFWQIVMKDYPMKELNIFLTGRPNFIWKSMVFDEEKPMRITGGRIYSSMPESCFLGGLDTTQKFVKEKMPSLWKKFALEKTVFYTSLGEAFENFSEVLSIQSVPWEEEKIGKFKIYRGKRIIFKKADFIYFLASKIPSIFDIVERATSGTLRKVQIEEKIVDKNAVPDIRESDFLIEIKVDDIKKYKEKYEKFDNFEEFFRASRGEFMSKNTGIL